MKEYFKRLNDNCPKWVHIFWWAFRLTMIGGLVWCLVTGKCRSTDPIQLTANLVCMFLWEIFMMFPEKSGLRHMRPGFQIFLVPGIFCASFCGAFLNFYYSIRFWDTALHLIGGAATVFYGYEYICGLMERDKKKASIAVVLVAAVGFSFVGATLWELFEFSFDQISGMMSGYPGDSQHWSYELAVGTPKINTIFDPIVPERWAIMDTMGDIVLNTVGAALSYLFLRAFPYRHKGKYRIDFEGTEAVETKKKAKAKAK